MNDYQSAMDELRDIVEGISNLRDTAYTHYSSLGWMRICITWPNSIKSRRLPLARSDGDSEMKHRLPPLSEMERIEQSLLGEKLDEILERIDKENVGFVITKDGLDEMVIIPFRWFAENFPDEVPEIRK